MWEPEFSNKALWNREPKSFVNFESACKAEMFSNILLVYWREHCMECSPPDCYHSCEIYQQRDDKRCVRMRYGIYPNESFNGLFEFGADVRFKRWAKLGTYLYPVMLTPEQHRIFQKADMVAARIVRTIFRFTNSLNPNEWLSIQYHNPQRLLYKTYAYLREKMIHSLIKRPRDRLHIDEFVMECYSFAEQPFRMQIEYTNGSLHYKNSVCLTPGINNVELPFENINRGSNPQGSIILYPENDLDVRVVFTWLDFVQKDKMSSCKEMVLPADKVKCVAWDLDNTLWRGVLIEDGAKKITIPDENIRCIRDLDERGIIQTVVSKNNHDEAWKIVEQYGLQDYFIYPAINWAPKSANLKKIAKKINIGLDTFALIDDSAFERAEVNSALPQVRVYTEKEIDNLLLKEEFIVPVSEESRSRRISYLTQIQREKVQEQFGSDISSFLKDCQIILTIFVPTESNHQKRCFELIQRSNQLNLSSRRYTEDAFYALLADQKMLCLALQCSDRFGNYGIIGFASVNESDSTPVLQDFVISCRVAQKKVEHTFIEWLVLHEKKKGCSGLQANMVKTLKNGPLQKVFEDLPFHKDREFKDLISYKLSCASVVEINDVITVVDKTIDLQISEGI